MQLVLIDRSVDDLTAGRQAHDVGTWCRQADPRPVQRRPLPGGRYSSRIRRRDRQHVVAEPRRCRDGFHRPPPALRIAGQRVRVLRAVLRSSVSCSGDDHDITVDRRVTHRST